MSEGKKEEVLRRERERERKQRGNESHYTWEEEARNYIYGYEGTYF
jgi:hypothetical protein